MKNKLRTTSFWLGLSGAVVIIAECISDIFNIQVVSEVAENIVITIASVLVLLGVVTKKNVSDSENMDRDELLLELRAGQESEEDK